MSIVMPTIRRLNNSDFDMLIVGSDQVWRKVYCEDIGISFLEFASKWKHIKRVAYAASFGTDSWEAMSSWQVKRCVRLARKFDAFSVREETTDSLHGMVFSIVFNRPFWVLGNRERGLSRFASLLTVYGLQNRLITPDQLPIVDLKAPIDWNQVNAIRKKWQDKSFRFLEGLLKFHE